MSQLCQWLMMGKYSIYVWPAYSIAGLIFFINYIAIKKYKRRVIQSLKNQYRGQG